MQTVLIVVHLMIVVALVAVVLLQRSEGGGLGIGGGGGGGLMTARGAANALTKTTSILGGLFFLTSITLGVLARYGDDPTDVLDQVPAQVQPADETDQGAVPSGGGVLDQLGGPAENEPAPAVPTE